MKTLKANIGTALAATLSLLLFAAVSRAEDQTNGSGWIAKETTNAAPGIVIQKGDKKITISGELGDTPFGLPKEILEKLSPDQIVELEKARRQNSQVEDVVVPVVFFGAAVAVVALVVVATLHPRNYALQRAFNR